MNSHLESALSELTKSGAKGLPTQSVVDAAHDGTSWNGTKSNGAPWTLTKNNEDSYNCMC